MRGASADDLEHRNQRRGSDFPEQRSGTSARIDLQGEKSSSTTSGADGIFKFAVYCTPGVETMLEEELEERVFPSIPGEVVHVGSRGLLFVQGGLELLWHMSVCLRLTTEIRVALPPFLAFGEAELMKGVRMLENELTQLLKPIFLDENGSEERIGTQLSSRTSEARSYEDAVEEKPEKLSKSESRTRSE
ncbi:unnamed protein product, partial [Amoebophrya sp. A25]|eukprot:GSA25T00014202001.1